jgi:hypothetical protein
MNKNLKLTVLALLVTAAAVTAHAKTTNLLQSVTVSLNVYSQGTAVVTTSGTKGVINHSILTTKALIQALKSSGTFNSGDVLVRVTPVPGYVTNLVPGSTTNLLITNESLVFGTVSNYFIINGDTPGIAISNTPVAFGTNIVVIDDTNVTLGLNTATVGDGTNIGASDLPNPLPIGSNTTVTLTTLTNAAGQIDGTNYVFVNNTLDVVSITNNPRESSWAIFNKNSDPELTPIPTNILFDIRTELVYDDGTNRAYMNGEKTNNNGRIGGGSTGQIRTLVLSNGNWNIRLQGYAAGSVENIVVGPTSSSFVYCPVDSWTGNGSGTTNNNSTPVIINGSIHESYYAVLKQ